MSEEQLICLSQMFVHARVCGRQKHRPNSTAVDDGGGILQGETDHSISGSSCQNFPQESVEGNYECGTTQRVISNACKQTNTHRCQHGYSDLRP